MGTADRDAHQESDMDDLQKPPAEPRTGAESADAPPEAVTHPAPDDTDVAAWVEHTHRKLP